MSDTFEPPDGMGANPGKVDREPGDQSRLLAPVWHTAALIAIFLAMAAYGAAIQHVADSKTELVEHRGSALPLYLGLIAAEWGLLRFVVAGGLKKTGTRMRDVIGARWAGWKEVIRDVAVALAVWAGWTALETLAGQALGKDTAKGIDTLLPRGALEIGAWVALSVTAGICEEAIFRGYLQKQFEAITGSAALAVLAQGMIFGVAHGYQGLRNTIMIALLGVGFGSLAWWRRNLRPGMLLHAWMDVFGGIFAGRA